MKKIPGKSNIWSLFFPDLVVDRLSRAVAVKAGRQAIAKRRGSGLDGYEHGGRLSGQRRVLLAASVLAARQPIRRLSHFAIEGGDS